MNSLAKRQRNARKRAKLRAHRRARALEQKLIIRYEVILRSDRVNFIPSVMRNVDGIDGTVRSLETWMKWSKCTPSVISHKYLLAEGSFRHDLYEDGQLTCPYTLSLYLLDNAPGFDPCCSIRISFNGGTTWHTITTEEGFVRVVRRLTRSQPQTMQVD